MSLSKEAIKTILGIEETVELEPAEMAKNLTVTFFPLQGQPISENIKSFSEQMIRVFRELEVVIISYEDTLIDIPFWKKAYLFMRFVKKALKRTRSISHIRFGKKVRSGITIIALGESRTGNLPMDNIADFRESNVITIVDMPVGINKDTDFHKHFDTAMSLFAHHMTNIIIAVSDKEWVLYNLNASHPIYSRTDKFKEHVLHALIPKITSPIPPKHFS